MKVYYNFKPSDAPENLRTTLTLGNFDGIHLGHQRILESVKKTAERNGEYSAVLTFDKHPATVLYPETAPKLITTLDEKLSYMEEIGINLVFIIPFTKSFSEIYPEDFIYEYLIESLGVRTLYIGYDHNFGKEKTGNIDLIESIADANKFFVEVQKPVMYKGEIIKSSLIRSYINNGNVAKASCFLGRDYSFSGTVVSGSGDGTRIGFPTANIINFDSDKIIPPAGVYYGWIKLRDQKMLSVISIGTSQTFNRKSETIEAHIIDFEGDIYGKKIALGFSEKIRDFKNFTSKEELISQIKEDIISIKK